MFEEDKRKHVRTKVTLRVKLIHGAVGDLMLKTVDISDGGIFLEAVGNPLPAIGDVVDVQVQGIGGDEPPVVRMQVKRQTADGIGLEFV